MTDMLSTGSAWLAAKIKASAGASATYTQGGLSCRLAVTRGRTFMRLADNMGGSRVEITDLDILFTAADLVIGGQPTEPRRADEVRLPSASAGNVDVYEVRTPPGEPPWRWSDPTHTMYRVHLKYVRSEPA